MDYGIIMDLLWIYYAIPSMIPSIHYGCTMDYIWIIYGTSIINSTIYIYYVHLAIITVDGWMIPPSAKQSSAIEAQRSVANLESTDISAP